MQDNLNKAFSSLGMAHNITEGGSYKDQSGGYYTGGNVFARSKVNEANIVSLQMPHYRAGCGGIDLFMGGFSFINGREFTQLLRNIGSNAAGYAFNLALATVTPQIKSVLDDLAAKVQEMTNLNINSCEAAATLVGGFWPQSDTSSQLLCQSMGTQLGVVSDWAQSRQKCGVEGERGAINQRKSRVQGFRDVLGDEFNLAWKAIQKNDFLKADPQLAEFFMTISGTIISRDGSRGHEGNEVIVLPSKSNDPNLITALMQGGMGVEVYRCDDSHEDRCFAPQLQQIMIPAKDALHGRVQRMLGSISDKIKTDRELSPEELGFVNATMIPVLKILAVEAAFKSGGSPLNIGDFSEAIAFDILLQYLDEIMGTIWDNLTQLKTAQINEHMIEEFRRGISDSRKLLYAQRTALFEKMATTLELIERTQQIEGKLQNMFISGAQRTQ